ncbi:hypothetical protein [Rhodobacter viridis]|uniref:hypothetical protein n=1 Tax=Rhodobacter viridis TaxID=1054202 RepID=UPI001C64F701|nr:hypothetical protein [Rhodobacter viridis]
MANHAGLHIETTAYLGRPIQAAKRRRWHFALLASLTAHLKPDGDIGEAYEIWHHLAHLGLGRQSQERLLDGARDDRFRIFAGAIEGEPRKARDTDNRIIAARPLRTPPSEAQLPGRIRSAQPSSSPDHTAPGLRSRSAAWPCGFRGVRQTDMRQ